MTMTRVNDNKCWFSLGPVRVLTVQQFGRSLLTYLLSRSCLLPRSCKDCSRKNSQGWTATVFFCTQGGGVLELCVRRVEEEMNGRCPGSGGVDTALG